MIDRNVRRPGTVVVAFVVIGVGAGGCPKREPGPPSRLTLARVVVKDHTRGALRVPGLTDAKLIERVKSRLRKSGRFELKPDAKVGAYFLKIDLGLRRDGDDLTALISARAESRGRLEVPTLQASATVRKKEAAGALARARETHLLAVLDRSTDDIVHQAMLTVAPPERVVAELKRARQGREALGAAIEIAAVRRLKAAVPALIALLEHEAQPISDRAIGALVAIGDRRAVKPLTRLTKFSDTARMAKVIDGIGALGGKEAKEYLEFVAVGHEDADIKNLAREALERMTRKAGSSRMSNKGDPDHSN